MATELAHPRATDEMSSSQPPRALWAHPLFDNKEARGSRESPRCVARRDSDCASNSDFDPRPSRASGSALSIVNAP